MIKLIRRFLRLSVLLFLFWGALAWYFFGVLPGETDGPDDGRNAGAVETCLECHGDMAGFVPAHRPQVIGCVPCHGGQPGERRKKAAHRGMVLVPGNLSDVQRTCGTADCHGGIADRVQNSLMSTMSGVVSVDRFVFGDSDSLSTLAHIRELGFERPSDVHLRHLCASCHLGNEKVKPAPVGERSRGGGCIACHLQYTPEALDAHRQYHASGEQLLPKVHPAISLRVGNEHCFGCHSRSGRISTNFEGWHETLLDPAGVSDSSGYRLLADGRVFRAVAPDVHHARGLECIDCHSSREIMGDGRRYYHAEEAVKVRCEDCHFTGLPETVVFDSLDAESKKILALRGANFLDRPFVVGRGSGEPLINVILEADGRPVLIGKNSGARHPLLPPAEVCTRGTAHTRLTCSACHTGWAPQCVGCHNAFDPGGTAFDLLAKKKTPGKWEEHLGEFFAEPPTLGIVKMPAVDTQLVERIKTFIPGMIMTIDKTGFPGHENDPEVFHRLFAPSAAHTTAIKGRTCASCHSDPLALGYGRGHLEFQVSGSTGKWVFRPAYAATPQDGLPQDAWIGFLKNPQGVPATRPGARPFRPSEQMRILTVGACLSCHQPDSRVMMESLENFERTRKRMSRQCVVPSF